MVGDASTGLLAPAGVALADLNGDGLPDLIIANSGSNNVLVKPGLPGGRFGQALNDGNGFFTGTDPVGITVGDIDGDGRPDLAVANRGSNDVSVFLNRSVAGSIVLVPAQRLKVGNGPTATARLRRQRRREAGPPRERQPVQRRSARQEPRKRVLRRHRRRDHRDGPGPAR